MSKIFFKKPFKSFISPYRENGLKRSSVL